MPLAVVNNADTLLCAVRCRAKCCTGAAYLRLTAAEATRLTAHAQRLKVPCALHPAGDAAERGTGAGAVLRFAEHPGERCPMLDPRSALCRIYADRPSRCRDFPDQRRDGCALSQRLPG